MRPLKVMYPFPIRLVDGVWHVLMNRQNHWIKCDNRHHARKLSRSQVLLNQAACGQRSGKRFSAELEAAAQVLDRYERSGGAQLCRYYADNNTVAIKGAKRRKPR